MPSVVKQLTFIQHGLKGYRYALKNERLDVYKVLVTQGHDTFIISKKCTHVYYVLSGNGTFIIDNKRVMVRKGTCIEVPPKKEYTYSGKMDLLLVMQPPWFEGNEIQTKRNPHVKAQRKI